MSSKQYYLYNYLPSGWRLFFISASIILLFVTVIAAIDVTGVLVPSFLCFGVYLVFCICLADRVNGYLFSELGFVYLGGVVVYTVLPGLSLYLLDFKLYDGFDSLGFASSYPSAREISIHLWRHVLYVMVFALSNIVARGVVTESSLVQAEEIQRIKVFPFLIFVFICVLAINCFSAPVNDYIDHYTRFNHLEWLDRKKLAVLLVLRDSAIYVTFGILFFRKKFRFGATFGYLVAVSFYQIYISYGSRIEAMVSIMFFLVMYHKTVCKIKMLVAVLFFGAVAVFFSLFELLRTAEFNLLAAFDINSSTAFKIPQEFGAVFYTGFHLYKERSLGLIPAHDTMMYFNDFLGFVPFVDHLKYSSQYWYSRNYFPDAVVPPQTMGPIVESAIWGGELSIIFSAVGAGITYGLLSKYFAARVGGFSRIVFCCLMWATCVVAIKYSIVAQLVVIIKPMAVVFVFERFLRYYSRNDSAA